MQCRAHITGPVAFHHLEAGCTPAKSGSATRCPSHIQQHRSHRVRAIHWKGTWQKRHEKVAHEAVPRESEEAIPRASCPRGGDPNATSETKAMHRGNCPEHQLRRTARAVQATRGCSHRGSCRLPSFLRKVTQIERKEHWRETNEAFDRAGFGAGGRRQAGLQRWRGGACFMVGLAGSPRPLPRR